MPAGMSNASNAITARMLLDAYDNLLTTPINGMGNRTLDFYNASVTNGNDIIRQVPATKIFYLFAAGITCTTTNTIAGVGSIRDDTTDIILQAGAVATTTYRPIDIVTKVLSFPIPLKIYSNHNIRLYSTVANLEAVGWIAGTEILIGGV